MSSKAKILFKGSILRVFEFLANALIGLALMPFIIHRLGDEMYGLWILVGSFLGYYGLMDFGLNSAVQRYISRAIGIKDHKEVNIVVNTALVIFTIIGIVAMFASFIVAVIVPSIFKNIPDVNIFRFILLILGFNFAIGFPLRVFSGILYANLRYDLNIMIELIKLALRTVLILLLLKIGYGIIALALITFFMDIGGYISKYFLVRHLYKYLLFSKKLVDKSKVKLLFSYSVYTSISQIADQLRFNVDSLVIAIFIGLSQVTVYSIGARLIKYFMDFITAAIGILMPVFSQYEGDNNYSILREKFIFMTKISSYLSIIIGAILIIFGRLFIERWVGTEYLVSYRILVILVIPVTIALMQNPSVTLLFGISKHRFLAFINILEGVANLILSVILVKKFGLVGVAMGTAIPMILIKFFLQPIYVCRVIKLNIYEYYFGIIIPTLIKSLTILSLFWLLLRKFITPDYFNLSIFSFLLVISFTISVYLLGINNEERKYFNSLFAQVKI